MIFELLYRYFVYIRSLEKPLDLSGEKSNIRPLCPVCNQLNNHPFQCTKCGTLDTPGRMSYGPIANIRFEKEISKKIRQKGVSDVRSRKKD